MFSNRINTFEVDLLKIEENGLTIIKCKNKSDFSDLDDLIEELKDYISEVEYNSKLLNAKNGILIVKVKHGFKEKLEMRFLNMNNITIKIISNI